MSRRETMIHLLALVAFFALATPGTARACWDCYHASIGRVEIMGSDFRWDPERARYLSIWLSRIDALVPDGGSVTSEFGYVTVCRDGSACAEHRWSGRNLARLFRLVADAYGSPRTEIRRARTLSPGTWTVQIGAFTERDDAARAAEHMNASDHGDHGFYQAGGFPADNPRAHVVAGAGEAGRRLFRVVVGTFSSRAAAEEHAAELESTVGAQTFVRLL